MTLIKRNWLAVGLALTVLGTATLGCSSKQDTATTQPDAKDASGPQTLRLSLAGEPDTLDSSKSASAGSFDIMNATEEGLYRLDNSGKPQPALAKDMPQISSDGLTYTIKLKDNVTWADGSTITAHDFEYAWKRTLDPKTKADYAFMVAWLKGGTAYNASKGTVDEVAVKATDDTTLQFTLERPLAFMTAQLAFPIFFPQKKEFVEHAGDKFGSDADKVLANGPFKIDKWEHEQSLHLVKNDKYWDAKSVKLSDVDLQIVKDNNTAENLYTTGALDLAKINSVQAENWKDKPDYHAVPTLWVWYLEMNESRPLLKNEKIRKAIQLGIDRETYVKTVYSNGTKAANGFVPTNTADGNNGDFRKKAGDVLPKYDPAKAKELLAEGMKELGLTAFPKLKLTGDDLDESKKGMEFLQAQLRQNLGIDVDVESIPSKLRYDRGQKKDYDLLMFGWGADYNDPMTFLDVHETQSPFNQSGFQNADYDKLIDKARNEPDTAKRSDLLVQAEKILGEHIPTAPIYYRTSSYLLRTNVKDMYFPASGVDWEIKWASVK